MINYLSAVNVSWFSLFHVPYLSRNVFWKSPCLHVALASLFGLAVHIRAQSVPSYRICKYASVCICSGLNPCFSSSAWHCFASTVSRSSKYRNDSAKRLYYISQCSICYNKHYITPNVLYCYTQISICAVPASIWQLRYRNNVVPVFILAVTAVKYNMQEIKYTRNNRFWKKARSFFEYFNMFQIPCFDQIQNI